VLLLVNLSDISGELEKRHISDSVEILAESFGGLSSAQKTFETTPKARRSEIRNKVQKPKARLAPVNRKSHT